MNTFLPTNIYSDVRTPVQPIYSEETTQDFKQLVGRINDINNIETIQMPLALGPSFLMHMEYDKMIYSTPMRLPGLETASIAKQIITGDDDDILLDEVFEDVDYCYPTFSIHEKIDKDFF